MILRSQKTDQQRKRLFGKPEMERTAERSSKNCRKVKLSKILQRHEKNVGCMKQKKKGRKNGSAFQ